MYYYCFRCSQHRPTLTPSLQQQEMELIEIETGSGRSHELNQMNKSGKPMPLYLKFLNCTEILTFKPSFYDNK